MQQFESIAVDASSNDETKLGEIEYLKKTIKNFIDVRKNDMGNVLPDTTCVRKNHNLVSFCRRQNNRRNNRETRIHHSGWDLAPRSW